MNKTHAGDDRDTSRVYASRNTVLVLLGGVNTGDDSTPFPLSNFGTAEVRNALIDQFLQPASAHVVSVAGRDFDYHKDVQVAINGDGSNRINVGLQGMTPLRGVSALVIDTCTIPTDCYEASRDGWIQYTGEPVTTVAASKVPVSAVLFTRGVHNVLVTATWGYVVPPEEIQFAANLFAAAWVLSFAEAFDSNTGADIPGGVLSWQAGDFRVSQRVDSRYGKVIKKMEALATGICTRYRPKVKMAFASPEPKLVANS